MHKKYIEFHYDSFKENESFYKRSEIFSYWRSQKDAKWQNHYDNLPPLGSWMTLLYASIAVNKLCLNKIGNFKSDL